MIFTELHEPAHLHSWSVATLGKAAPTLVSSESTSVPPMSTFLFFSWLRSMEPSVRGRLGLFRFAWGPEAIPGDDGGTSDIHNNAILPPAFFSI